MKQKPTFQFSSLDKTFYQRIEKAIKNLDGNYDLSKIYSAKATHLIVDKMGCTEKILCFIAAGKWIVTQSYIKSCLKEGAFLDEQTFQVSVKFPYSKLAQISSKWRQRIIKGIENSPFFAWNVAFFIENVDKANALSNILRAGSGNFANLSSTTRFNRSFSSRFTVVIYDDSNKTRAIEFAKKTNIPYYPFQCVPDYLMQGIKSDLPVLPIEYYERVPLNTKEANIANSITTVTLKQSSFVKANDDDNFLKKFKMFLSKCSHNIQEPKYLDSSIDDQFMNLWANKAYYESFFVLSSIEFDKLPSVGLLSALFEFLLDSQNFVKKNFKLKSNQFQSVDSIYDMIYLRVLTYLTSKILKYPSKTHETYTYFYKVFENLMLDFRMSDLRSNDAKGLIDVIYLVCIHDYLMINLGKKTYLESFICKNKLDKVAFQTNLVDIIIKDKNSKESQMEKLMEILAFTNAYVSKSKFYKKILELYNNDVKDMDNLNVSWRSVLIKSIQGS